MTIKRKGRSRAKRDESLDRKFFRQAAIRQRVCQAPGCKQKGALPRAHHVVYAQHVKMERPLMVWDTRNAMRLCDDCHAKHHNRTSTLPTRSLPPSAIDFAIDLFGSAGRAVDYLRRYYDDTEPDPRLEAVIA